MKFKICIISTVDITLKQFVIPSARLMKEKGADVTFLSSMSSSFIDEFSEEFDLINIEMDRGAKPLGMIKGVVSFYSIFNKRNFDMIQYATPNAAFYASIAGALCNIPARIYCQWGIRYVGFEGIKRKLFKGIEKITTTLSTHVRPASYKNMVFAISEGLYDQSKARIIGPGGAVGIDLKVYDVGKREEFKTEILSKHPQLENKTVFGFVGRLSKDKGLNELIRAFIQLNNEEPNSALLIVGPIEDNGELDHDLLERAKLCDDIIFTGYSNEVRKYLSVFTIHIHPSYREGFSLVIQQAMAMGVPVITTDIPGPSEVIEENFSGLLVPSKDSASLYSAMKTLLSDEKKQLYFAKNGLERVRNLFTEEQMSNLIFKDRQEIFESLSGQQQ